MFFGLSGTGKTTLSADPARTLIGDDEHGWSDRGTFNFEGGCYAKTINLSAEAEPEIYATTTKFGTVIENMIFDPETFELDFDDDSLTANMRCAYPLEYISNASDTALGGHPKNVIMLTCDAFGVLPPIARLTPAQAMYHFLSGFTSKVAGTERGVTEPENFGFDVPVSVEGVAEVLLDPRRTWHDPDSYDRQAAKLVQMFADNFAQYVPYIDEDVKAAAIG